MTNDPAPSSKLDNLRGDVLGGITAGIVALPLALGFGHASGLGAAAGLYGAIALGILAALFGGTPSQVSGPTGPMTVVAAGLAASIAAAGGDAKLIFLAVALAGALQIALGLLRLGRLIQFVPYPVVSGFMSGIGVIIICLQFPVMLGSPAVKTPLAAIQGLPSYLAAIQPAPLLLALGTVALIYGTPRITRKVPGTLVGLVVMTVLAAALGLKVDTISAIPSGLPRPSLPTIDAAALKLVLGAAVVLAVLGAVDSLLTSLVADRITGIRHDSDRELVGQGIGNIASGLIGGLPGAGATMRTVVNVQSGGRTRLSGAVHGMLLLGVLLGLAPLAQRIPLAVLAGILLTVGIGILDYRGLRDVAKVPRGDAAVMLGVLVLTVVVDLMWAVGIGVVASCLVIARQLAARHPAVPASELAQDTDHVAVVRAQDALFFGNANRLQDALAEHVSAARALVLCLRQLRLLDQSGAYALADAIADLRTRGVQVYLAGLEGEAAALLDRLGVAPGVIPAEHVFSDAEAALQAALAARAEPEPAPAGA